MKYVVLLGGEPLQQFKTELILLCGALKEAGINIWLYMSSCSAIYLIIGSTSSIYLSIFFCTDANLSSSRMRLADLANAICGAISKEEIEQHGIEHGNKTMNISKNRMGEKQVLINIYADGPNYRMYECK